MNNSPSRILRIQEVMNRTGKKRTALYAAMKNGNFPKCINLGSKRSVGWLESEVEAWIAQQVATSRNAD